MTGRVSTAKASSRCKKSSSAIEVSGYIASSCIPAWNPINRHLCFSYHASTIQEILSMALFSNVSFSFPIAPIASNKASLLHNSNLVGPASLPMNPRCSIARDHRIVSTPPEHFGHRRGHPTITDEFRIEHANKLETFKRVFREVGEDPSQGLVMIDAIQRLGIDHHFQYEIDEVLQKQYMLSCTNGVHDYDLHEVALRFRLLRQEGYFVPAGVFDRFKDREGSFRNELRRDIKGLMELYEASQLAVEGEDILDRAKEFSSQALKTWQSRELDRFSERVIKTTLDQPYHKSLSRFTARNLLTNVQGTNGWINVLQELAKMDFNIVQSLHQEEVVRISNWWKDLGLAKELEFARDQPLKWYIWSMASLTNPNLSEQRIDLTKPISLIYIIDDIFDVYGTLDELTLFTQAVDRWDYGSTDRLPDYMKICFKALDDITDEISHKVYKEHGWNPVNSLRKAWATLCRAFLVEARWFASGKLPKAKEYLENGITSSGVHIVLVHIFFLLGQGLNNQHVELIDNNPGMISSTATILRLWDDLGSAKDENQDGNDGSYVDCYMKEHQGVEVESVRKHVTHMISNAWKRLNHKCLSQNSFSLPFARASLNIARMVPLMYSYNENQCLPSLEEYMECLLFESDENQDGNDGSYVECYMKEHQGVEVEVVRKHVTHMISNAWKRLNHECLSRNPFSLPFARASQNIARMVPLMYSYDENQCLPSLEEYMRSLLYESVPVKSTSSA
ncbi:hypothetical protein SCA6_020290 [Theobroma cacao]